MIGAVPIENPTTHTVPINTIECAANFDPTFGGVATSLAQLTNALGQTGDCLPTIVAFNRPVKPDAREFPLSRVAWSLALQSRTRFDSAIKSADIVHIHGIWQQHCARSAAVATGLKKPYAISAHGMLEPWALNQKKFKKKLYSLLIERRNLAGARCLRALTSAEANNYREYGLTQPIAIIPNGVNPSPPTPPAVFLEQFPHLQGKTLILFLGRIHPKKGLDILLHAWSRITTRFTDAHLVIAGPDFDATQIQLEQLAMELKIRHSISFSGMLLGNQKHSALAAASAFILPSHSEGFSMAILEALAAGIPVIATHQCNFPEIAASGSGWLISPDAKSVEQGLRHCLESSAPTLKHMGDKGTQLIRSRFSWPTIAGQMVQLYKWMIDGTHPINVEIR